MRNLNMLGRLLLSQVYAACIIIGVFFYLVNQGVVSAIWNLF